MYIFRIITCIYRIILFVLRAKVQNLYHSCKKNRHLLVYFKKKQYFCTRFATEFANAIAIVAQLVEQRIRNAWVAGSSPASGSKQRKRVCPLFVFTLSTL